MLNYQFYGNPDSTLPPLLVFHGLLGSLDNWHTFAKQVTERSVIALDMRNHGRSPHVTGMSYQLMVEDVQQVLQQLNIQRCAVMGHSMGGKVAMLLALRQVIDIEHLIVVDIAPVAYPPRHQALLQAMLAIPLSELNSRKQADDLLSGTVKNAFERGFLLKNLIRNQDGTFSWLCHLSEIARHYLKLTSFPDLAPAKHLGKTLFIVGGKSDYMNVTHWQQTPFYFPNATLQTIMSAGHLPHVEAPADFTQQVNAFLQA